MQSQQQTINCAEFARRHHVKPDTIRARICRTGSYFGIRPLKLANGKLAFPAAEIAEKGAA
jgi:hypothetical protein